MLIETKPSKVDIKINTCPYHQKNAGTFAGCTCSTMYSLKSSPKEKGMPKHPSKLL